MVCAYFAPARERDGDPVRRRDWAGSPANRPRCDVVGLAVTLLALVATARAQGPGLPSPAPARDLASILDETEPNTEPLFPQPLSMAPSFGAGGRPVPIAPGIETGLLDTVTESLFGDGYAEGRWRPLSLSTFFSEGWLEPGRAPPAGQDGLTPRHGWRGAFDGVFYRLWIATFGYSNSINAPYGGNRYFGNYTIFLPFSRRFEIVMNVPFVVANGTKDPMRGYTSEFGDLAVGAPLPALGNRGHVAGVRAWDPHSDWNDGDGKRDHIAGARLRVLDQSRWTLGGPGVHRPLRTLEQEPGTCREHVRGRARRGPLLHAP